MAWDQTDEAIIWTNDCLFDTHITFRWVKFSIHDIIHNI